MDALTLLNIANSCITGEQPPCACACPLGLEVRAFVEKLKAGSFSGAYKLYAKHVVFPGIVSRICTEPCKERCIRSGVDGAVALKELERACCNLAGGKSGASFYIPPKNKTILVVGGGLGGLSCAVKLAQRGYTVELHEEKSVLGGRLWELGEDILPRGVLEEEFSRLEDMEFLSLHLNSRVERLEDYTFDAVLIATGKDGDTFGTKGREGVFLGGSLLDADQSPLRSIRQGVELSYLVEAYVKVGAMKPLVIPEKHCGFQVRMENIEPRPPVPPVIGGWGKEEAQAEADRCLLCDCRGCLDVCDMLTYYRKNPKKAVIEINDTVHKTQINTKLALRMINSCTQCGLCGPACPAGVDFKELCIDSRRELHRTGSMPEAFHEFWLDDMAFSGSESAALSYTPPGAKHLFFPGCQMGASDPGYVVEAFRWLDRTWPGKTGILLRCCAAPAYWAGREELHERELAAIRKIWEEAGKPQIVTACPTCQDMFRNHLPEMELRSFWSIVAEQGVSPRVEAETETVSIFDSCTSKYSPETQEDIRKIVEGLGYRVEELPSAGEDARCCGYGGLIYSVNPRLVDKIREENAGMGERDYVTYCVNCRDSFALAGKPSYHILDLLFPGREDRRFREAPSLTRRRENRVETKNRLMKEIWDVDFAPEPAEYQTIRLELSPELEQKMDRALIHGDNVKKTIHTAETTGSKVFNPAKGTFTTHLLQGIITYWVEYAPLGEDVFQVKNVYKHRMRIEEQGGEHAGTS